METDMGKIYKITNIITGKVYIGKTILETIEERFTQHVQGSRKTQSSSLIHKSLREYGTINHTIELLEECSDDIVLQREQYWIDKYNSLYIGYNIKNEFLPMEHKIYGGNPDKAKENLANGLVWNVGINVKEDTKQKIRSTRKKKKDLGLYKNSYGHKHTEETKKKLSSIAKSRAPISNDTKQKLSEQAKNRKFYYSIDAKKRILIKDNDTIPDGYVSGKGVCAVYSKSNKCFQINIWEKEKYLRNGFKERPD